MSLPVPYYDQDGIVIYNADCRNILPLLPKVDLVLTDPPYGIGYEYHSYYDTADNLRELIDNIFPMLRELSTRIAISIGMKNISKYPSPDWLIACIWNTTGSRGEYGYNQWFPVFMYGKDIDGIGKVNGVLKSDLLSVNGGSSVGFMRQDNSEEHPCAKPLNLISGLVNRLSKPSDLILDPFLGSGTTLVAAKKLGRRGIGIEIEEKYCEIAIKRLSQNVMKF